MDNAATARHVHLDGGQIDAERLHQHLLRDHHRAWHELDGLPLEAVHELEHFDQSMGLLHLHHAHAASTGDAGGYSRQARVA